MPTASDAPVVIITGGTGGVGRAACELMAKRGYRVAFTYNSREHEARALEESIGPHANGTQINISQPSSVETFVNAVHNRFGRVDSLIHAAGPYVPQKYVSQFDATDFHHHVDIELFGFFTLTKAILPKLRETQGSIVAVTSFAVRHFPPRDALSSVPKAGVEALIRAIAVEEGKFGIRANCVGPGALADGMTDAIRASGDISFDVIDDVLPTLPMRRLGTGREVAQAACFLASPDASYITGQVLDVDGGFGL